MLPLLYYYYVLPAGAEPLLKLGLISLLSAASSYSFLISTSVNEELAKLAILKDPSSLALAPFTSAPTTIRLLAYYSICNSLSEFCAIISNFISPIFAINS